VRDLSSEYAKARATIPRSSSPLEYNADGTWNIKQWQSAQLAKGTACRAGDQIQITKITLEGDAMLIEINGGLKSGKKFMDHVSIGVGVAVPVTNGQSGQPTFGTVIELNFHKPMENLSPDDVKKILSPLFEWDKHSVTKVYSETLPPDMQHAIAEKRAIEGMTREEVVMALGHPDHKYRETSKQGVETEDWIYGNPPGKITFVTFQGPKVVKVKDEYAGLGIQTQPQSTNP